MNSEFDLSLQSSCGDDVIISSNVEIKRPGLVSIGNHVAIDAGFYMTTAARFGDYIHVSAHVTVIGGSNAKLNVMNFTSIAAGARIIVLGDEHLGYGLVGPTIPDPYKDKLIGGEVTLEDFAAVGTNAIILPGLRMAQGSVLGAGAVLTKDTLPWTIYVGNPARPIKSRDSSKMLKFADEIRSMEL